MLHKALIISLLITPLIPSIFLNQSSLRYFPIFLALFASGVYAMVSLKDRKNLAHLKTYYQNNKYILIAVLLFVLTVWSSSFKAGIKENLVMVAGMSLVLIIIHFLFPILIQKREDFALIPKTLFFIGLLNSIVAISLLLLNKYANIYYGIYRTTGAFPFSKFAIFQELKVTVLKGIFSNPNSLGILIAFVFPAALFLIKETKSRKSMLLLTICALLLIFTLLSSFSRTSILSTTVVLFFFFLFLLRKTFLNIARILMVLIILSINFIIVTGIDLSPLKKLIITSPHRIDLWNKAIQMIHNNIFSGIGASNTVNFFFISSHNTFIEIALGTGIGAMITYSLYLILLVIKIKPNNSSSLSAYTLLSFLSFSILQVFETLLFGGLSIANFYFIVVLVSYLSMTSSNYYRQ